MPIHLAFPLAKLGALFIRHISKPMVAHIMQYAKTHPVFRNYLLKPPAQFYNWCEVKMKMWILNLGKPVEIPKLNETMAIELGANLLGESIIFIIAATVLYLEYARQVRKETAKEDARKDEISTINFTVQELYFQAERQDAQIRELLRIVGDLQTKIDKRWRPFGPAPPPPPSSDPHDGDGVPGDSVPPNVADPHKDLNLEMSRYNGGIVFSALDYLTYQIPYILQNRNSEIK